jgi:hypothetical protein
MQHTECTGHGIKTCIGVVKMFRIRYFELRSDKAPPGLRIEELPCFYAPAAPGSLFDMMRKSMVRATYVYGRQSEEVVRAQFRVQPSSSLARRQSVKWPPLTPLR